MDENLLPKQDEAKENGAEPETFDLNVFNVTGEVQEAVFRVEWNGTESELSSNSESGRRC